MLPAAMVLLVLGCSEQRPVGGAGDKAASSGRTIARIVISVPGDDIGSPESVKLLEDLTAALLAREAGSIVSSGFGRGTVEVVVALDDGQSLAELRNVLGEVRPQGKYRIEQPGRR